MVRKGVHKVPPKTLGPPISDRRPGSPNFFEKLKVPLDSGFDITRNVIRLLNRNILTFRSYWSQSMNVHCTPLFYIHYTLGFCFLTQTGQAVFFLSFLLSSYLMEKAALKNSQLCQNFSRYQTDLVTDHCT